VPDEHPLSPREFLRQRRPERFSDTRANPTPRLDRSTLEYHLSTLTSRSQETDFQNFALHLAERAICPNLRPQTGPTGGGDSKADAESYPVTETLAEAWYEGDGNKSASERWAFAFSAQKKWKTKVESDVAKIAKTKRGYTQAFFIGSQFIADKKRAEVEDALRKKHKFQRVTILDRNWILNEVFKRNLQELAIADLRIDVASKPQVEEGPLDARRRKELEELEKEINELLANRSADTRLVRCAIEAGRLARELELPKAEVDGRYRRAMDLAEKYGSGRQQIEALYQFAWATFWWQEDFGKFVDLYLEVEKRTKASDNIAEVKLLFNLWHLILRVQLDDHVPEEKLRWNDRVLALADALERITKAEEMPSAALEARVLLLFQQVGVTQPNISSAVFTSFKELLEQSEGLIGFPLKKTIQLIGQVGEIVPESPEYDQLNEAIASILEKYEGETGRAGQLVQRAHQKMDHGHDYDAIELAGRALELLWKNETQTKLVHALYILAIAYRRIGLPWAARGALLNAAAVMVNNWRLNHEPEELRVGCFGELKWIELVMGRLPDSLAWYYLEQAVRSIQGKSAGDPAKGDLFTYGAVLGIFILRVDLLTLKRLERLPDALENLGLGQASAALLWALGWEDVATEGLSPDEEKADMFLNWRDQPAARELPTAMDLGDQPVLHLKSNVLGCTVNVDAENNPACRLLAESFLAALESSLATGFRERLIPMLPLIEVSIAAEPTVAFPFVFEIRDTGAKLNCRIKCQSFDPNRLGVEEQSKVKESLFQFIVQIVAHTFPFPGFEEAFRRLFFENGGFKRALSFTGSFVTLGNVLGHTPPTKIDDWIGDSERTYELKRTKVWDDGLRPRQTENEEEATDDGGYGGSDVSHESIGALSIINLRLWDEAGWRGTMFGYDVVGRTLPLLALGFDNAAAAEEIFAGWRERFGKEDPDNAIRVVIVQGISSANPAAYRVGIYANPESKVFKGKTFFSNAMRANTMEHTTGEHLRIFLDEYRKKKAYLLTFAKMGDMNRPFDSGKVILKRDLVLREAWSIGPTEIETIMIQAEDDPFIPEGKVNPPIAATLAQRRGTPADESR